jgi:hypothetical protein
VNQHENGREPGQGHGWCSLRVRFGERELVLLRGSEKLRGSSFAHHGRPEALRSALTLAKAGQKIGRAREGTSVVLDEGELRLLLDAVRFAIEEVQWARSPDAERDERRRGSVLQAFPELVERGLWRSFGLTRDLETLTARLEGALQA